MRSVFTSNFDCLAEIELLRAGFNPSGVGIRTLPTLTRDDRSEPLASPSLLGDDEAAIRAEMERRITARLASVASVVPLSTPFLGCPLSLNGSGNPHDELFTKWRRAQLGDVSCRCASSSYAAVRKAVAFDGGGTSLA